MNLALRSTGIIQIGNNIFFEKKLRTKLAALFLSATAAAATITQEGSGIGKDGEIKVVFEDGKIKNVDILKQQENPVLSQKVFTDLKDEIVKTDSPEHDVIAGAIYSSLGRIASQQAAQVAQAAK